MKYIKNSSEHKAYLIKERLRNIERRKDPIKRQRLNLQSRISYRKKHDDPIGRDYIRKRDRNYIQKIKLMVFNHYSSGTNECACCKENNIMFLSLDHINNNGNQHRKKIGRHIYLWLYSKKYPSGFQILCYNCNHAKHLNGGICPHVK